MDSGGLRMYLLEEIGGDKKMQAKDEGEKADSRCGVVGYCQVNLVVDSHPVLVLHH